MSWRGRKAVRLTAKDRLLLHLLDYAKQSGDPEVPVELTREGIARACGIRERHVPQYARPLMEEGLVRGTTAHVRDSPQRRKIYRLTPSGIAAAMALRESLGAERLRVKDENGVHERSVSEVLRDVHGRVSTLDLLRAQASQSVVDVRALGLDRGELTGRAWPLRSSRGALAEPVRTVQLLQNSLGSIREADHGTRGEANERLAGALFQCAMRAGSPDEFRDAMASCESAFATAKQAYQSLADPLSHARASRCEAQQRYASYWLGEATATKKRALDTAWRSAKESLAGLESGGDGSEYAQTFDDLSFIPNLLCAMEESPQTCAAVAREAVDCGEKALRLSPDFPDAELVARIGVRTAGYQATLAHYFAPAGEKEQLGKAAVASWRRARDLSPEAVQIGLLNFAPPDVVGIEWGVGSAVALENLEKAREIGERIQDNFLVGGALDQIAYNAIFAHISERDPQRREELARKAWECANEARVRLARIGLISPRGEFMWAESPDADYFWALAYFSETDPDRRRELLDRAIASFPRLRERTEACGYPLRWLIFHESSAEVLSLRARLEPNVSRRCQFLEQALAHKRESVELLARLRPHTVWGRGYVTNFLADIEMELAETREDPAARVRAIREAIEVKEDGVRMLTAEPPTTPTDRTASLSVLEATARRECGDWLLRLFGLTGESRLLLRAIDVYGAAVSGFLRRQFPAAAAECRWRIASARDLLQDYLRASEEFTGAAGIYKSAADELPQLHDLYEDLALYLQAWGDIEKARYHHSLEEYGAAGECYGHAATLHSFTRSWSYLAPNYAAWAQLEQGEELSRRNTPEDAQDAFRRAADLFDVAKSSLQGELDRPRDPEERRQVEVLARAADVRRRYAAGRTVLEEGRILDRAGSYSRSARAYREAAETFERLAEGAESGEDQKSLKLIGLLARAWGELAAGESDATPAHFAEAARLFQAARDLSPNEKAKALALGHSRYSQALEAGTEFADRREPSLHAAAIRSLESAAGHYVRAGAADAAEFARATKLLFDGYAALDRAYHEADSRRTTMDFTIAETVLQSAADGFGRAGHVTKRDQVLQLLVGVRKDRAVAKSLAALLRAPELTSTMSSFAMPRPSHESAVGVQRFEHAEMQVTVVPAKPAVSLGEDLRVRLLFTNAGKGQGSLVRVEGLPSNRFHLVETPEGVVAEAEAVLLGGMRLAPFQTAEIVLVLRPPASGPWSLRARLVYLDDAGESHVQDSTPVLVVVSG